MASLRSQWRRLRRAPPRPRARVTGRGQLGPQLPERPDAGALLLAPEKDPLPENVDRDHLLRSAGRAQRLALLGEPLPRGDVELVLVLEAAEQPPAPARDLGRVEGEVLVLGEGETHRPERGEPARAAVFLPAPAHSAHP